MCSAWPKARLRASARETCEAAVGADAVATHLVGLRAEAPRPVLHETVYRTSCGTSGTSVDA
jgi:hypothetical protein